MHVKIVLDGENQFTEYQGVDVQRAILEAVCGLPAGMQSGMASVGMFARTDAGQVVYVETSMRLFLQTAVALRARYGDEDKD